MATMTRIYKLSVFVIVLVLALAASAFLAFAQEGVRALPSRLTLVYREPGSTGEVVAVFTASTKPLKIVGRDESGAYLAVELEHGQGWVAAGELELTGEIDGLPVMATRTQPEPAGSPQAVTAVLTKVYAGPEFSNEVIDILMPHESLQVLGRSADSHWLVVRRTGDGAAASGWIPSGDARLNISLGSLPVI